MRKASHHELAIVAYENSVPPGVLSLALVLVSNAETARVPLGYDTRIVITEQITNHLGGTP